MAGRGPAPKPTRTRPNDQARRDAETTTRVDDGVVRGPELPSRMPPFVVGKGEDASVIADWPAQTLAWWDTWRRSPQAQGWGQTDWDFLLDTAVIHGRFWWGDLSQANELRLRVAKFGATPEDRQRLREQIVVPPAPTPAPTDKAEPGSFAARRAQAMKAAAGGA